jgi:hypothetical protein
MATRAEVRAAGVSDGQISRRVTSGRWRVPRRGLLLAPDGALVTPAAAADVALAAALASTAREVVVGHAHAARLWGLPEPRAGWGVPVLLAASGPTRSRRGVRVLTSPLADPDVVRHRLGILVTSPARTVSDCLRVLPAPDALAVADAAARLLVPAAHVAELVESFAGWRGVLQARRLAALVDGRRESPLESWSAVAFDDLDVPAPAWQVDVRDAAGFVGQADCGWACGVVGEADGRAKYVLAAAERGGADADGLAAVLAAERERERRLRQAGLDVVRWGPRDVLRRPDAEALARYLRATLAARGDVPARARVSWHTPPVGMR